MRSITLALSLAAFAQTAPSIADDHQDQRRYRSPYAEPLPAPAALDLASRYGLARVKSLDLDDEAIWKIEGWTHDGREMQFEIDGWSGQVLKLDVDDDGDRRGRRGGTSSERYDDDDDDDD